MTSLKIVVPDDFPISYGSVVHPDLARLQPYGDVVTHTTRFADRAEFFSRIAEADVVINVRAYSRFDDATRESARAEYIASIAQYRAGSGYRIPGEFVVSKASKGMEGVEEDAKRR